MTKIDIIITGDNFPLLPNNWWVICRSSEESFGKESHNEVKSIHSIVY